MRIYTEGVRDEIWSVGGERWWRWRGYDRSYGVWLNFAFKFNGRRSTHMGPSKERALPVP